MKGAHMQLRNFGFNWKEHYTFSIVRDTIATDCAFLFFRTPMKVWTKKGYREIEANTGIFWKHGVKQVYYPVGNEDMVHDFIYVDFDTETEKDCIQDIPICSPIYFPDSTPIISAFEAINNEIYANTQKQYKYEIYPKLIEILFIKIRNAIDSHAINPQDSPYFSSIGKLRYDIYNNVKFNWTLEYMSNHVNISSSHFHKLYKQFFLTTATNDIIRARITKAKSMLRYSNKSIYDIAEECGYNSAEHFIRQFKKLTNATPKQYRNKYKDATATKKKR